MRYYSTAAAHGRYLWNTSGHVKRRRRDWASRCGWGPWADGLTEAPCVRYECQYTTVVSGRRRAAGGAAQRGLHLPRAHEQRVTSAAVISGRAMETEGLARRHDAMGRVVLVVLVVPLPVGLRMRLVAPGLGGSVGRGRAWAWASLLDLASPRETLRHPSTRAPGMWLRCAGAR